MKRRAETDLIAWKEKWADRVPLIIDGVRRAGKIYLLRWSNKKHFKNVVYISLGTNLVVISFFNSNISSEKLLYYLEASAGEKIIAGETLVIFDEIQSCKRTLTSLRYFCEETPEFHVAAAESLLGVAVNRQ